MKLGICNEKFNTVLKVVGIILVLFGFFSTRIDLLLLGIFFILLVISNMLTCESFELSNQIGNARDEIKAELKSIKSEKND